MIFQNTTEINLFRTRLVRKSFLILFSLFISSEIFAGVDQGELVQLTGKLTGTEIKQVTPNVFKILQYQSAMENSRKVSNVISLSVIEESIIYIPNDFTATVNLSIDYGSSATSTNNIPITLTVDYHKGQVSSYDARKYFKFEGAEYVKMTVVGVNAPLQGTFDPVSVLLLQNEMNIWRYYENVNVSPTSLNIISSNNKDGFKIGWSFPQYTGNTYTQVEWAWIEFEMESKYLFNGSYDYYMIFKNNASRIDIPHNQASCNIPLLYDGSGKVFYRIRPVHIKETHRIDGPWAYGQYTYELGHEPGLNWQVNTSYAEDGKSKTVMQYFDGSLRARQTVTKDNETGTTTTAETFYDGEGRPAVQVLPAPGISGGNNVIEYIRNLNKFNSASDENPAKYFDLKPVSNPLSSKNPPLLASSGASLYYSPSNPTASAGMDKNIPDAEGYPYTVTRYTPDASGRIMAQSGVGKDLAMGNGHDTRYYYGTPAQEELDGLFGTEVGIYSHYFKNMVQDPNGQMSVSYVDMHGRTIATALTGSSPITLQPINGSQNLQSLDRNLLANNSNIIKGNALESINTLLLPSETLCQFKYSLTPSFLKLFSCPSNNPLEYDCHYNLEISISNDEGDYPTIIRKYNNISPVTDVYNQTVTGFKNEQGLLMPAVIDIDQTLQAGSWTVRKTLSIAEKSLSDYKNLYAEVGKGMCKTEAQIIDSVKTSLASITNCNNSTPLSCTECNTALGDLTSFRNKYLTSIGLPTTTPATEKIELEIVISYNSAKETCNKICNTTSQTVSTIRELMLLDMVPFSGQYARNTGSGSMFSLYNIFQGNTASGKKLFQAPRNGDINTAGNYYNSLGAIDLTIHPNGNLDYQKLNDPSTTSEVFTTLFNYAWAQSLLPYHPEYPKLVFAESVNMKKVYNWGSNLIGITTFAAAQTSGFLNPTQLIPGTTNHRDPFYDITSEKAAMEGLITGSGYSSNAINLNMWAIAYGDVKCKSIVDLTAMRTCYSNAETIVQIQNSTTLTSSQKDQMWVIFRNLYLSERNFRVNKYIKEQVGLANAQALSDQNYHLHFPETQEQLAKQSGMTSWYPPAIQNGGPTSGTPTNANMAAVYSSRCSSYITRWRNSLLQCDALDQRADKETILTEITNAMVAICSKGSDEANPFGASDVPTNISITPYRNFEEAIRIILANYGITKDRFCNPHVIEFPKPHNKGERITKTYISVLDNCTCSTYNAIRTLAATYGVNTTVLPELNIWLQGRYNQTLTQELFTALNNCTSTLITPQPLPDFIKCGFNDVEHKRCYDCSELKTLTNEFKAYYPDYNLAPIFTIGTLTDDQVQDNMLYARYINYKTGFQYSWIKYSKFLNDADCNVHGGNSFAPSTAKICKSDKEVLNYSDLIASEGPCERINRLAEVIGHNIYMYRMEALLKNFEAAYIGKCLDVKAIEQFSVSYDVKEYHYTLYYYDQAGNLVKTVPPKGVKPNFSKSFTDAVAIARTGNTILIPTHTFKTDYRYNSLNAVIAQQTPDGGISNFWYDNLGRLVVSQNAKQSVAPQKYSYTVYDLLGRIVEVGQKNLGQGSTMTQTISRNKTSFSNWIFTNGGLREEITNTKYDEPGGVSSQIFQQYNLRSRVSYSSITKSQADHYSMATYYSYDIHGNVKQLLNDYYDLAAMTSTLGGAVNHYKIISYDYDLISGKVNEVGFQAEKTDAFYHRYHYDFENRLKKVETSRDKTYWEDDANYTYYRHGPLARTELGKLRVQGVDYVYTLQGWLKAVNPVFPKSGGTSGNGSGCATGSAEDNLIVDARQPVTPTTYVARQSITFEPGFITGDGEDAMETFIDGSLLSCTSNSGSIDDQDGSSASTNPSDVYKFNLNYYENDYRNIGGGNNPSMMVAAQLGAEYRPLYNGNINSMGVSIAKFNQPMLYNYQYDQLNRLTRMDGWKSSSDTWSSLTKHPDYKESISYDGNGNILTYLRNGANNKLMDNMLYSYDYYTSTGVRKQYIDGQPLPSDAHRFTNRLNHIEDVVGDAVYPTEDIDTQPLDNYVYDEIGNLIKDTKAQIKKIEWNVYGKIASIEKDDLSKITYTYDASGNRISKTAGNKTTVYVRDASGNTMSVYEQVTGSPTIQAEIHLYGSSRIGIQNQRSKNPQVITMTSDGTGTLSTFTRGEKIFELSNHLGNVMVTVNDRKNQHSSNNTSVDYWESSVVTANDYYPFGMLMPGRSFSAGNSYRYGFNGKENDNEVKGDGSQQDYGMRIYDPRIGKFLSVDPITNEYPELTPYQFASNRPIEGIDLDGLEFVSKVAEDAHFHRTPLLSSLKIAPQPTHATPVPIPSPTHNDNLRAKPNPAKIPTKHPETHIAMPDMYGKGHIGPKSQVEENVATIKQNYYSAVGASIASGPFGAAGYHISKDRGAFIGSSFDALTFSYGGVPGQGFLSKPRIPIQPSYLPYTETPKTGVSPNVQKVLNTLNNIPFRGGTIKLNPLGPKQEINMTITQGTEKLDFRIETHSLPPKYGGDGVTPQRHMNVDLYPNKQKLPNGGHKILNNGN